ncbi:MAG TPA: ATP-binding protein [Pirellulales bacterium]|nr:ATP-binding protein [Pirellulales bacterium]
MINELKSAWPWPATAAVVSAALAIPAGYAGIDGPPAMRCGWLLAGALAASGPWWFGWRRAQRQQHATRRWLERLAQTEPRDWADALSGAALPVGDRKSACFQAFEKLQERLAEHSRQLAEAEHARAALEIRSRRAAEQAERARLILGSLPEPVIAVDTYGALSLANPSAERLFGFDAQAIGAHGVAQCLRSNRLAAAINELRRYQSPTSRTEEFEIESADGQSRWYKVTTTTMPGEGEGGQGAVVFFRDISTAKANQRQNAEFVSAASHEMKTPLAGIKAYVELLADGDAEDEATREEFLGVINGQADRLQRLIDNLLNIARIEAGAVKVSKQSQPLNEILTEAFRVVQPSAEAKQIRLVQDMSPLYLGVLADRDMLLQAAINLMSNAVKYTPPGGQVTLRSRLLDSEVSFEVEDTGVGLGPEDCRRVFDKFYRVEKNKQMASGTGLGLPLARYIVEDVHNGRLALKSRLGEGSVFTVTLPRSGQMG